MKKIYGLSYYDFDYNTTPSRLLEAGREYFVSKKERDDRAREISAPQIEKFEISLTKKNIYELNYHGVGKDKKYISKLRVENQNLKDRLNKIKLALKNIEV